jgi:hypothetical protein
MVNVLLLRVKAAVQTEKAIAENQINVRLMAHARLSMVGAWHFKMKTVKKANGVRNLENVMPAQ